MTRQWMADDRVSHEDHAAWFLSRRPPMKRLLPLCTLCILSSAHPVLAAEKSGMELSPLSEPRSAITLGLLQGASLIGFDHERLLTDRVGFQFGAGLLGFDCGLTYHYRPGIRSRHFYLGYWNVGLGVLDAPYAGILGLTHVWRSRGKFTAQLGLGTPSVISDELRDNLGDPSIVALYSIGVCGSPRRAATPSP